jgi:PKHD-type hydroxylase
MSFQDIFIPPSFDLSRTVMVEGAFAPADCDRIVQFAQSLPRSEGDIVGAGVMSKVRRSQVSWIPQSQEAAALYERMHRLAKKVNEECYAFRLTGFSEQIQYAEYPAGHGYYDWHVDIGKGVAGNRKLSIVIQLSDRSDYEGGELQIRIRKSADVMPALRGTAIVFPSFLLHRVTPVTRGLRRSLTLWISGPPFA